VIRIEHIFVSPGHNYFGHNGQPPGEHALVEVDEVECVPGRGLRGDRFFDFKENYKGQITFFAKEVFERLAGELRLPEGASPGSTRRNVITSGIDLNSLVGREFEIQGLRFEGVEECRPCHWMNHAYADERVEKSLKGNGGLRARILTPGFLRKG
jgi:MOSC domain-containing protein YiiM